MNKVPIICLCGSTKFKEEFLEVNKAFTLEGAIILMPGVFRHSGDKITDEEKTKLDMLHKYKIIMSDAIYVINKNNYIGQSTKKEIEFAKALNKPIYYYNNRSELPERQEEDKYEDVPCWANFYLRRFTKEY